MIALSQISMLKGDVLGLMYACTMADYKVVSISYHSLERMASHYALLQSR
jgi:hypothetical protein